MNPAGAFAQSGSFVTSAGSSRFRIVSEPMGEGVRGTVVFVHAFAEEMNKSRRMTARMARLLAGDGWRVVQRDLCGCGDSSGDFADATWGDWVRDVDEELSQVIEGRPTWLWCERAGALLAPAVLATHPGVNLLLWQPVVSGAQHLQQFLRLHSAARIVGTSKVEGGLSPIQSLRAGVGVEVAGYPLNPALALGMEQAWFHLPAAHSGRVVWFEVSADEVPGIAPQSARVLDHLRGRGIAVDEEVVRGSPFWQTLEIEECEVLLVRTRTKLLADTTSGTNPSVRDAGTDHILAHDT